MAEKHSKRTKEPIILETICDCGSSRMHRNLLFEENLWIDDYQRCCHDPEDSEPLSAIELI